MKLNEIIQKHEGQLLAIITDYVSELNEDYPGGLPQNYEFSDTRYYCAEILEAEGIDDNDLLNELQEWLEAQIILKL
jgi:hypothetical protein